MDPDRWKRKKSKALQDGDLSQVVVCCKELADLYVFQEDYQNALKEYKEMEAAAGAMNSEMDVARANRMIGEMYCEIGEFDQAIHHQQKHLSVSQNQGDKVEEQRALATLGRTYFMMSESCPNKKSNALSKAKQFFDQSLALCDQLSDSLVGSKQKMEMKARLFLNVGLVHDDEGRLSSAVEYMQQAVGICKKFDLWEDLYKVYLGLACVYRKNGMNKDAISIIDKAIPVAERLSSCVVSVCELLSHKAEALLNLPDFRGARQALLRAYKLNCPNPTLRKEIERTLRIVAAMCSTEDKLTELSPEGQENERKILYENLGDMASELRAFSVALTYYTLMLQCVEKTGCDPKSLIQCYVSLAQTYNDDKQYKKAVEFFRKEVALEKDNHEEACKTYLNIAELYHVMGKNANALEAYKAARSCAEAVNNSKLLRLVLGNLKQHFIELGSNDDADKVSEEMEALSGVDESSDEEDLAKQSCDFGADINLDDLSDPEGVVELKDNSKLSRTRTKSKSNIHKKNELGETPLHRAAIAGNLALATKLIEQGHSVDVRDYSGWTPLHEAANHGHVDIAELLIRKGAPVNDRGGSECNGVTPLLDAASCGHFEVMELLLKNKASPLMKNNDGMTILDLMFEWKTYAERENGGALDQETLAQYEAMYSKLLQILERAGQKPTQTPVPPSNMSPSAPAILRRTNTRRLIYDDADIDITMPEKTETLLPKSQLKFGRGVGAASDYESTMRALRFRTKDTIQDLSSLATEPKKALIPVNEAVGDDWLEEDIVRPNKKRKTCEFFVEPAVRRGKSNDVPVSRSPSPTESFPDATEEDVDWATVTEPLSSLPCFDPQLPSTSGSCSNKLKVMNLARRKEISFGSSDASARKILRTVPQSPPHTSYQVSPTSSSVACVRVLVEDKLLLVPVPSPCGHLTVEWLAEETAKRYKSLEGVEPRMRLLTTDGAILLNSDPLSLVLSMGELRGTVLSWNLPSLVSLYEEWCCNNNMLQENVVVNILEACPSTGAADFSDTCVDAKQIMSALKVLSHHQALKTVNLSGNYIPEQYYKELAENLVKLTNLKALNLSNTMLTKEGISILSQAVRDRNGFRCLQSLEIGFNPLSDCLKQLGDLVSHLPALTRLELPSANVSSQSFRSLQNFTLDTLESINVNYNEIGTEGVVDLLGRLNPRCIQELHFAHAGGKTVREVGLYLQINAPSLRCLDLSYCPASEEDMHQLIQGLELCPHLEKLALEGVSSLDQKNVNALMSRETVRSLNVAGAVDALPSSGVVTHLASLAISSCAKRDWPPRKGPFGLYST